MAKRLVSVTPAIKPELRWFCFTRLLLELTGVPSTFFSVWLSTARAKFHGGVNKCCVFGCFFFLPCATPISTRRKSRSQDTVRISGEDLGTLPPCPWVRAPHLMTGSQTAREASPESPRNLRSTHTRARSSCATASAKTSCAENISSDVFLFLFLFLLFVFFCKHANCDSLWLERRLHRPPRRKMWHQNRSPSALPWEGPLGLSRSVDRCLGGKFMLRSVPRHKKKIKVLR